MLLPANKKNPSSQHEQRFKTDKRKYFSRGMQLNLWHCCYPPVETRCQDAAGLISVLGIPAVPVIACCRRLFFFAMELHEVIPLVVAERQAPLSLSGLVSNTNGWTEELLFDSGDQQLLFRSCRQQRVTAELNGTWCVSIWWKARSWRDLEGSFLQRNQTHL